MVYSKAKLKSSGDRVSPCFKPLLIGNMSDRFLRTWTLLYVSVRHVFISLTCFMRIPDSIRILGIKLIRKKKIYFNGQHSYVDNVLLNCFDFASLTFYMVSDTSVELGSGMVSIFMEIFFVILIETRINRYCILFITDHTCNTVIMFGH
jgi:hypothetical protein